MTNQEIKMAGIVCCPMCDEKKCVGRFICREIKQYIEKKHKISGELFGISEQLKG